MKRVLSALVAAVSLSAPSASAVERVTGVVYDAVTRAPVAGAVLRLTTPGGVDLAPICIQAGGLGPTGADGIYDFTVDSGTDPATCPVVTDLTIGITAAEHEPSVSVITPPEPGALSPPAGGAIHEVSPLATPPLTGAATPYFRRLLIEKITPDVINNHIALDPLRTGISGLVHDVVTGATVGGATVNLFGPTGAVPTVCLLDPAQQGQTTGAGGDYRFDLHPGVHPDCPSGTDYTITVSANGFSTAPSVLRPDAGTRDLSPGADYAPQGGVPVAGGGTWHRVFTITRGDQNVVNNHLPLDPFFATLSGTVHDSAGTPATLPITGASVTVTGPSGALANACFIDPAEQGQSTPADGRYSMRLRLGADASCPDFVSYTVSVTPAPGGAHTAGATGSTVVALSTGTSTLDVPLVSPPLTVSGIVYNAAGTPAANPLSGAVVTVTGPSGALPDACYVNPALRTVTTPADGSYAFALNIGDAAACPYLGSYTVAAAPPAGFTGPNSITAQVPSVAGGGDRTGVNIPLTALAAAPTVTISGFVNDANAPAPAPGAIIDPIAGAVVTIDGPGGALPDACYANPARRSQTTAADGTYSFTIIPDADAACANGLSYTLHAAPPGTNGYVTAVSTVVPNVSSTAGDVIFTRLPLARAPVSVSGTVRDDATGAPVGGATVTITGPTGALAAACLAAPTQAIQITPLAGTYLYTLVLGADASCPDGGSYGVVATPDPAGGFDGPGTVGGVLSYATGSVTDADIRLRRTGTAVVTTVTGTIIDVNTGLPVPGIPVWINGPSGPLDPVCYEGGTVQVPVSDTAGLVVFRLVLDTHASCPSGGVYQIVPEDVPGATVAPSPPFGISSGASVTGVVATVARAAGANALLLTKQALSSSIRAGGFADYQIIVENPGAVSVDGVTIADTPPFGFSFVTGSATLDGAAITASSVTPPRFGIGTLSPGARLTLRYRMRVAATVPPGVARNSAVATNAQGTSAVSTAAVTVETDALFDDAGLYGKVFYDCDADGWQDYADHDGVVVQGGVAPGSVIPGTLTVDHGQGPHPAKGSLERGVALGTIPGYAPGAPAAMVTIRARLSRGGAADLNLISQTGTEITLDRHGAVHRHDHRMVAKGQACGDLTMTRTIAPGPGGGWDLTIMVINDCRREIGVPGARVATVGGLVSETDRHGRYHIVGPRVHDQRRGTMLILKLDTASLPAGSTVTTENPRSLRTGGGMMTRMNFGVSCPAPAGFGREVFATLDPVCFYPGTAMIDPARRDALVAIAAHLRTHGGGEVQVTCRPCQGEHDYGLNEQRARVVQEELSRMLPPDIMRNVRVTAQKTAGIDHSSVPQTLRGGGLIRAASLALALLGGEAEAGAPGREEPVRPIPILDNPYLYSEETTQHQGGYLGVIAAPPPVPVTPACPQPGVLGPVSGAILPPGCAPPVRAQWTPPPITYETVPVHQTPVVYQPAPVPAPLPVYVPPPVTYSPPPVAYAPPPAPAFTIETRPRVVCPEAACVDVAVSGQATLKNGATVWASADAFADALRLGVRGPRWARLDGEGALAPLAFHVDSNYDAFIAEWEVAVFRAADHGLTRPLVVLPLGPEGREVVWDGMAAGRALRPGETLVYVVRAYALDGAMDVSAPRELLITDADTPPEHHGPRSIATAAPLISTIRPHGGTLSVRGADIPEGWRAHVAGEEVPVAADGTFEWRGLGAPGAHSITVVLTDPDGADWTRELALEVAEDHLFMVGLADLMVGQDRADDALEAIASGDAFDEDIYARGRLAFFLKGKIKGRYLITAQADTKDGDIEHLFDGFLDRRDPQSVFRRLDPDRYYPVYGDDSTTWSEVDTQGKLYVRLEADDSSFVWGNYNTGFTGTVLGRYSRSLYGARGEVNLGGTRYGEPQLSVKGFASEPGSVLAHNEFLGTGGSLYYLRRQDIVTGSEKAFVEIRDRETGRVLERHALVPGKDYQIDDLQGRIILARPLRQWAGQAGGTDIVERRPVDDDLAYLVVDYEYVPDGFGTDDLTFGGRALAWLGDYVGLGGTYVTETRDGSDYELIAADATLRYTPGTYLKVEYAESEEAQAGEQLTSLDGGLYFDAMPAPVGAGRSGEAWRVDARVSLVDLFDTAVEGDIAGWWARREGAFSTIGAETRRFVEDYGATVEISPMVGTTLSAEATRGEDVVGDWMTTAALQIDQSITDRIGAGAELRYDEEETGIARSRGWTAGVRLSYDVTDGISTYVKGQTSFAEDGGFQDATGGAVGFDAAITDKLSASGEFSWLKEYGTGATLGLDYALAPDHSVYGSVTRSTDRTDARKHAFTVGQRRGFGKGWSVYTENQFGFRRDGGNERGQSYGIDGALTKDASIGLSYQRVDITGTPRGDIERDSASAALRWKKARVEGSLRGEVRRDDGALYGRRDQWLASARGKFAMTEGLSLLAEAQGSQTKDRSTGDSDAKFWETSVGLAWRPVYQDRLNVLARYTWLYDLPAPDQISGGPDKRFHVASAEAGWRVTSALDVALRGAHRRGEVRYARDTGGWDEATASFGAARVNWHALHKWDVMAEYRGLYDHEAESMRHGALVGLYRHFGDHFKLGAGYNFTAFGDDLTDIDEDAHGWFLNAVGTF